MPPTSWVLASAELHDFARIDSFMQSHPALITYDKIAFNEYAEFCRVRTRTFGFLLRYQKESLELAIELIEALKKEYHLK